MGISVDQFWALSMDEWQIRVEGAQQRDEFLYQLAIHQAWHTAYLYWLGKSNKFPSLDAHLKKFAPKKVEKKAVDPSRMFQDSMRSKAMRKPADETMPRKRKAKP